MRAGERLTGTGRWEGDALGYPPITLEPIEELLERHTIQPDMVRADPEIDRPAFGVGAGDA